MTAPVASIPVAPTAAAAPGGSTAAGQAPAGFDALLAGFAGEAPAEAATTVAPTLAAAPVVVHAGGIEPQADTSAPEDETAAADGELALLVETTTPPPPAGAVPAPPAATPTAAPVSSEPAAAAPGVPAKAPASGAHEQALAAAVPTQDDAPAGEAVAPPSARGPAPVSTHAAQTEAGRTAPPPPASAGIPASAPTAPPQPGQAPVAPEAAADTPAARAAPVPTPAKTMVATPDAPPPSAALAQAVPPPPVRPAPTRSDRDSARTAAATPEPAPSQRTGGAAATPTAAAALAKAAAEAPTPLEIAAVGDAPEAAALDETSRGPAGSGVANPSASSAANTEAPAVHAVRGAPETVATLAAQIIRKLDARATRFDIELDPIGLGKVDVRVDIGAHGRVTAAMSFENPQAAAELRARAGELQRALEQAGFDLSEGLSFDVAGDQGRPNQGRHGPDDGASFRGRAFQAALDTAGEAAQSALGGALTLRRGVRSGVDVRI